MERKAAGEHRLEGQGGRSIKSRDGGMTREGGGQLLNEKKGGTGQGKEERSIKLGTHHAIFVGRTIVVH